MSRQNHFHESAEATVEQILRIAPRATEAVSCDIPARPFLKWVGGKRSILPILTTRLPNSYSSYNEPFVGGGALFFNLKPQSATLSDVNLHLVLAYTAVRDDVDALIALLRRHESKHNKTYYLRARKTLSTETNPTAIAALLIYLNKTGFNGLYRVNKGGQYNVPMGDYRSPAIADEAALMADHLVLQGVKIVCQGFNKIRPTKGAFYYLDPPYHETYDGYNGSGFGDDKHRELAEFCHKVNTAGGYFMLSNSDTPFVRMLYNKYTTEQISASRSVSCKAHQRGKTNELLIRNYK